MREDAGGKRQEGAERDSTAWCCVRGVVRTSECAIRCMRCDALDGCRRVERGAVDFHRVTRVILTGFLSLSAFSPLALSDQLAISRCALLALDAAAAAAAAVRLAPLLSYSCATPPTTSHRRTSPPTTSSSPALHSHLALAASSLFPLVKCSLFIPSTSPFDCILFPAFSPCCCVIISPFAGCGSTYRTWLSLSLTRLPLCRSTARGVITHTASASRASPSPSPQPHLSRQPRHLSCPLSRHPPPLLPSLLRPPLCLLRLVLR
jgi:hypothetical protein